MKSLGRPFRFGAGPRSVAAVSLLFRARAAPSVHLTAARLRVRAATLRAWADCGVGPLPDGRGVYRRDVVAAWVAEVTAQRSAR